MNTLVLVYKYKNIIQRYVYPEKIAPHPNQVFIHLLNQYMKIGVPSSSVGDFIANALNPITKSHTQFGKRLIRDLADETFDLPQALDNYLKTHALNKTGDFFAMLIAFFYFYQDFYARNCKEQPLHQFTKILNALYVYKNRIELDRVDEFFIAASYSEVMQLNVGRDNRHILIEELTGYLGDYIRNRDNRHYYDCREIAKKLEMLQVAEAKYEGLVDLSLATNFDEKIVDLLDAIPIPMTKKHAVIDKILMEVVGNKSCSRDVLGKNVALLVRLSKNTDKEETVINGLMTLLTPTYAWGYLIPSLLHFEIKEEYIIFMTKLILNCSEVSYNYSIGELIDSLGMINSNNRAYLIDVLVSQYDDECIEQHKNNRIIELISAFEIPEHHRQKVVKIFLSTLGNPSIEKLALRGLARVLTPDFPAAHDVYVRLLKFISCEKYDEDDLDGKYKDKAAIKALEIVTQPEHRSGFIDAILNNIELRQGVSLGAANALRFAILSSDQEFRLCELLKVVPGDYYRLSNILPLMEKICRIDSALARSLIKEVIEYLVGSPHEFCWEKLINGMRRYSLPSEIKIFAIDLLMKKEPVLLKLSVLSAITPIPALKHQEVLNFILNLILNLTEMNSYQQCRELSSVLSLIENMNLTPEPATIIMHSLFDKLLDGNFYSDACKTDVCKAISTLSSICDKEYIAHTIDTLVIYTEISAEQVSYLLKNVSLIERVAVLIRLESEYDAQGSRLGSGDKDFFINNNLYSIIQQIQCDNAFQASIIQSEYELPPEVVHHMIRLR